MVQTTFAPDQPPRLATDIGGGVFLTRPENLGSRQDVGVEATANGRLLSTLRA